MSYNDQLRLYQQLRAQGVDARAAYQQAFPEGIQQAQQKEQAEKNSNNALAGAGGTLVGAVATKYAYDGIKDYLAESATEELTKEGVKEGVKVGADVAANTATGSTAQAAPEIVRANFTQETASQVGQQYAADAAAEGATVATEEGAKAAADAAGQQAAETGLSAAEIAQYAAWAYTAYKIYDGFKDKNASDEAKAASAAKQVGLAVADYYIMASTGIPGVATAAYATAGQTKEWRQFEESTQKMLPMGTKIHRKTTTQIQGQRYKDAMDAAATDADREFMQDLYNQQYQASDHGKSTGYIIENGPLAGRKYDWKEVEAFAKPEDVWGAYGFLEAFPDWISGYTEDERRTIAQAALDNDLLVSDKGVPIFSGSRGDLARIRDIAGQVKVGAYQPTLNDEMRQAQQQGFAEQWGINLDPNDISIREGIAAADIETRALQQEEKQQQAQYMQDNFTVSGRLSDGYKLVPKDPSKPLTWALMNGLQENDPNAVQQSTPQSTMSSPTNTGDQMTYDSSQQLAAALAGIQSSPGYNKPMSGGDLSQYGQIENIPGAYAPLDPSDPINQMIQQQYPQGMQAGQFQLQGPVAQYSEAGAAPQPSMQPYQMFQNQSSTPPYQGFEQDLWKSPPAQDAGMAWTPQQPQAQTPPPQAIQRPYVMPENQNTMTPEQYQAMMAQAHAYRGFGK